jgi:DNA-binding Lrp family transcriptional regulator
MRRFGAAINHKQVGFKANAMACWIVPSDMVDDIGRKLASLREVSHCYERKTNPLWSYNLFAMIHGHTREVCQEIASKISDETGIRGYILLFSTREFKKVRIKYQV